MSRGHSHHSLFSRRFVLAGGAMAMLSGLAACGDSEAPVDDQGRVRLRFATDWSARAEHGGFYQALASGAYQRRGLNVEIVQGRPGVDVPGLLASGAVELGLASDSFTPMTLVAQGAPVKAVAAFFQKDPRALITHPDPDLTGVADLKDRPFLLSDEAIATLWPWLRPATASATISCAPYDAAAFLADDQAVVQGLLTSTPYAIQRAGDFEPRVFALADDGYPSYASLILAPDGFARDNAAALRSFIAASAEGWRDYLKGDPYGADALIRKADPAMTQAALDDARARLDEAAIVDGGDAALYGLGAMTAERWRAFFEAMSGAGIYPAGLRWRDAFTDAFLPGRG